MAEDHLEILAQKCEAVTGPNFALEWEIHCRNGLEGVGAYGAHPNYTASLDTATKLVPEGYGFKIEHNLGFGTTCSVGHVGPNKMYDRPEGWASAFTPALALCAAALRAREYCTSRTHPTRSRVG